MYCTHHNTYIHTAPPPYCYYCLDIYVYNTLEGSQVWDHIPATRPTPCSVHALTFIVRGVYSLLCFADFHRIWLFPHTFFCAPPAWCPNVSSTKHSFTHRRCCAICSSRHNMVEKNVLICVRVSRFEPTSSYNNNKNRSREHLISDFTRQVRLTKETATTAAAVPWTSCSSSMMV